MLGRVLASASLAAGFVVSGYAVHALTFAEVEKTCPIDGTSFRATIAISGTRFGMRLDRKPLGAIAAPAPLPVCPTDRFVFYKPKFAEDEVEQLRPFVRSSAYQQHVAGNSPYFLAALMMEHLGEPPETIGFAYLQASWEFERSDREKYRTYLEHAFANFERSLAIGEMKDSSIVSIEVLCAELQRLLADFDAAAHRLEQIEREYQDIDPVIRRVMALQSELIEARSSEQAEVPSEAP